MKVVILAGGYGTRLSEETISIPKPMIKIGDKPILHHIMEYFSTFGHTEFIICLGYKGCIIKDYFTNYLLKIYDSKINNWKIHLIDTGLNTMTGGRIKKIQEYIGNETFLLTYGDGLTNIDIDSLITFHRNHKKIATVTAVNPNERFGIMDISHDGLVKSFIEKPKLNNLWINGGFFVLEPEIFNYIKDDETIFENEPMINLVNTNNLVAYKHHGFWKCMDTLKEKNELENMWLTNNAPWKIYNH